MTLLMPEPEAARALGLGYPEWRVWWAENVLGLTLPTQTDQQPQEVVDGCVAGS